MKKLLIMAIFIFFIQPAYGISCPKNVHMLTPDYNFADGVLVFKYLDMDVSAGGVQDKVTTKPSELLTGEVNWIWGPNCPECLVYVNSFGSWDLTSPVTEIFSGYKGGVTSTVKIPFSFKAPATPGTYRFRIIFAFDKGPSSDFHASNLCSQVECEEKGECHILIAEGEVIVTEPGVNNTLPPSIDIISPISTSVSGIVTTEVGSVITINAKADKPVNFSVEIDGNKVSDILPYSWNTFNLSEGSHTIAVIGRDNIGNVVRKEITVILTNTTLSLGQQPILLWSYEAIGEVNSIDVSPDGKYIAAGTSVGVFYLFGNNGEVILDSKFLRGVRKTAISSGGEYIALSTENVLYYLQKNGTILWNTSFPVAVNSISITPDGEFVAVGSGNIIKYFDKNGVELWSYSTSNNINDVSISSDGEYIAAASGNVIYYLKGDGSLDWTFSASRELKDLSITSDGAFIAATTENTLYYLDKVASILWNYSGNNFKSVTVASNGEIITVTSGSTIILLERRGRVVSRFLADGEITLTDLSSQGDYLAYASSKKLYFLDNSGRRIVATPSIPRYLLPTGVAVLFLAIVVLLLRRKMRVVVKKEEKPLKIESSEIRISKEKEPLREQYGKVLVKVVNSRTKKPIPLASVSLRGLVKTTDERGEASFENVPLRRAELSVVKEEYEEQIEVFDVDIENKIIIEMNPRSILTQEQREEIQRSLEILKGAYEKVSTLDTCIPNYYVSVAERIAKIIEMAGYSPEVFKSEKELEKVLDYLITKFQDICKELSEIMVDWRNIKIYKAAGKLDPSNCMAGEIDEKVDELQDLDALAGRGLLYLREEIRSVDKLIISKMDELTVLPVSSLWKISKYLADEASSKEKVEKAINVFLSKIILNYSKDMLENDSIVKRLKFALV